MYDPAEVDMPVTYLADDSDKPKHLQNGGGRFAKEPDDRIIRKAIAKYWGLCTMIDDMVGKLVQTLADAGTLDNTLIIYASDHGDHMGDWSRSGKGTFWEPSARVPLIVVPPTGQARTPVVEDVVETFQIAPTILDYAGVPIPEAMAATSLRPVIEGKANLPGMALSDYIHGDRVTRGTALITNRYKYAYWGRGKRQRILRPAGRSARTAQPGPRSRRPGPRTRIPRPAHRTPARHHHAAPGYDRA